MKTLTHPWVGAMLCVGGVETSDDCKDGSHPESSVAIFMPGFPPEHVPLWREGEEYNTRKGNNSAQSLFFASLLSFYPPAASEAVGSLSAGALDARKEAFIMSNTAPATRIPSALSLADLNTTVNHEPRISHVRLAEALGYSRPIKLAELIERHRGTLERFAEISSTVDGINPTVGQNRRGRPSTAPTLWLSKKQALYIISKAETEFATEITIQMVEVFDALLRGELTEAAAQAMKAAAHPKSESARLRDEATRLREDRLLLTARQKMLREVGKLSAVSAHKLAKEWGLVTEASPAQNEFSFSGIQLRDGMAVALINGTYVLVDMADTAVQTGDRALLVHNWSRRTDPFVSPVHVLVPQPGHTGLRDVPAKNGITHLPPVPPPALNDLASREVRVLGRVLAVGDAA